MNIQNSCNATFIYTADGNLLTSADINQYSIIPMNQIHYSAIKTKLLNDFIEVISYMDDESVMTDEIEQTIHQWSTLTKVS